MLAFDRSNTLVKLSQPDIVLGRYGSCGPLRMQTKLTFPAKPFTQLNQLGTTEVGGEGTHDSVCVRPLLQNHHEMGNPETKPVTRDSYSKHANHCTMEGAKTSVNLYNITTKPY